MARNDIADQLLKAMTQYSANMQENIEHTMKSVSTEALHRVKAASPRRTGAYSKGWRVTMQKKSGDIGFTVHQKSPTYRLTHLLEEGHRKRGGRGRVAAQPHIREVERWAAEEVEKKIEKEVKG